MSTDRDLITGLVVGQSITLTLGVPAQSQGTEGVALREGRWIPAGDTTASLWKRLTAGASGAVSKKPVSGVVSLSGHGVAAGSAQAAPGEGGPHENGQLRRGWLKPSRKSMTVALASVGIVTATVLAGAALLTLRHKDKPLPLAAAAAPKQAEAPQAIAMMAAPFDPQGPGLPLAAPQAAQDTPVPAQVLAAVTPEPVGVAVRAEVAHVEAGHAAPAPTPKRVAEEKQRPPPPAVIIDEAPAPTPKQAAPQPARAPAPAAAASKPAPAASKAASPAAAPAQVKASAASAQVVLTPAPAAKPAMPRGTGLVTITPDGKVAVFSNPKTRMPEQYKLGDTLPNGETVRAIQPKEGKVITNAKEYNLD